MLDRSTYWKQYRKTYKTEYRQWCKKHILQRRKTQKLWWAKRPELRAYYNAIARCKATHGANFRNYTQRGIQFLFKTFQKFLQEVGKRPSSKYSIDRVNVNGNYEKGNLRWATDLQQRLNKRKGG